MPVNPFFYGRAVSGSIFIDRTEEIRLISSSLERGQSVILFSPRRYGKTSLIRQVLTTLEKRELLVFYLDLYRITSIDRFAQYYSQSVLASLHSGADKVFSFVRTLVPSLKPKLTYAEPNQPKIELEITMEALKRQSTFAELFNFIERYCDRKKLRACIVFDEFQEITSFDTDGLLEREMRSAFQHHASVSYAFLGSKVHLMHGMFKDKNRPFYNFGTHFELGTIDETHWTPFIGKKFRLGGVPLTVGGCREVIACTGGHPYYTQMICSELWEQAVHSGRASADGLLEAALVSVLSKENHAFVELWDSLTPAERRFISAVAETGQSAVYSSGFIQRYHLGAASSVQRVVERLMKRGIIDRTADGWRIIDPLFFRWIGRDEVVTGRLF